MTTEGYVRRRATADAKRKSRYATDAEYRAKVKAASLKWYYANRERVLERQRFKRAIDRAAQSVGLVAIDLTADVERALERMRLSRQESRPS